MASYYNILQQTKPRFESPAKVFAKLKSRVLKEEICEKEGTSTDREPRYNTRKKHGAVLKSPRKQAESTWMTDDLKESHRSGCYLNEAQALTLSPISSPQKTFGNLYSDVCSKHVEDMSPAAEIGHGSTLRKRALLGSRALPHLSHMDNGKQIHTEPPQMRAPDGFSGTPVEFQQTENDFVSGMFEEECPTHDKLMSPAYMLSPMRDRQRKRKWEPQVFNRVDDTNEVSNESISGPGERRYSPTLSEDNNVLDDFDNVRGDPSEMNQFTHEPVFFSPRHTALKRCFVSLDKCPPMSPAKMFAYMKERESKNEQQEVHPVCSSTRDLFGAGNLHQSRDTPPSSDHNMSEVGDSVFNNVSESVVPVDLESADSQSDTQYSEDTLSPPVAPQPVSLEDPLLLGTPRISIPKRQGAVFKQPTTFPSESVIYLKNWFLRMHNKGLFVDGIHGEDKIPWHSNIIVDRVSNSVVKTVSGRVYILVGKMNMSVDSDFPKWLLKKFTNGFPPNWKALYEKFLSESKDNTSNGNTEGRSIISKKKSEVSSIVHSVKQSRQKPLKTSVSIPPDSSGKVSRSGRTIKPPLEYWKGGRVIVDAHMNVTIHEGYDTSICIPEVTATVSRRASKKPARVLLPCSEGRRECESASEDEASVLQRKVKAPLRKRNKAKAKPQEKPSYSLESDVETPSSSEEWSGRPATERTSYVDTVPQKQSEPEKSSMQRSKRQTHDTTRPSESVSAHTRAAQALNKTTSPGDEVHGRKKTGKEMHRERGRRVPNKSRQSNVLPSSDSSKSSKKTEKGLKKRTTETQKKHKKTKSSSPTRPLPKVTQSKANKGKAQIPQEQDADEWTEAELRKLQEAVSHYPKHMAGYWAKVASMVGTRSAEECHCQHTSQGTSPTPAKKAKKAKKPNKSRKEQVEAPKHPVADQLISARAGTLKRKQQVRQFLENMPKEDVEDVFSSAYMQNKRFEMPSMCSSEQDFTLSEMEPLTPMSTGFPEVKTPQCLHITPGMMGSPNRSNDDKYVYQLQKRLKKTQFNMCKKASSSKSYTPTPSVKRTMRRCANTENNSFVVWEMFPGRDGALSESGEEEDFYFSDND